MIYNSKFVSTSQYNKQNISRERQLVLKIHERKEFVLSEERTTLIASKRSGLGAKPRPLNKLCVGYRS